MAETENKTPSRPPQPLSRQKKKSSGNILKATQQDDEYRQSKPFSKKYGHGAQTRITSIKHQQSPKQTVKQSKTQKHLGESRRVEQESRGGTKNNFNQRLKNNIIKDQQQHQRTPPSSRNTIRIVKKQGRSPKKVRDDLIVLNGEEFKMQKEILELHKRSKHQLEIMLERYRLPRKDLENWMNEDSLEKSQTSINTLDSTIAHLNYLFKIKEKTLNKLEKKIADNKYLQYLSTQAEEAIAELSQSEQQEDVVEDLPVDRPQLHSNIGKYSQAMPTIKNKSYGLNMRRTYDVFKEPAKDDDTRSVRISMQGGQEVLTDKGDNRMTFNQKFKDFLLN